MAGLTWRAKQREPADSAGRIHARGSRQGKAGLAPIHSDDVLEAPQLAEQLAVQLDPRLAGVRIDLSIQFFRLVFVAVLGGEIKMYSI